MAKMYALDGALLVGKPELRIGEKIYPVDDRQKTVKKVMKICEENEDKNIEVIEEVFKLVFSKEHCKEIENMDISFKAYQEIFMLVIAACTGEDPKEVEERFQEAKAE